MTTYIGFVLDMSGSMGVIEEATVKGSVEYLKEVQDSTPEARLHLTVFDDVIEEWLVDHRLGDVDVEGVLSEYKPRNSTALLDAVGATINSLKKASKEKIAPGEALQNRVLLVMMTDGYENASQKWTRKQVADEVRKLTKRGNWTFVYLGANVDAWAEASKMGISVGNTLSYSSSVDSTQSALRNTAKATGQRVNSMMANTTTFYEDAEVEQDVRDEDDPTRVSSSS